MCIEEYRELSPQEEADLEDLLKSGRENAIQDAVAFMENLSEELSQLDQSNIHSLMGSEEQIEQLMEYLDGGIMEVEKMEMRLNVYDELLAGVRETMQKLSFQYSHILRQNTNLKSLCDEVDVLVVSHHSNACQSFDIQCLLYRPNLISVLELKQCYKSVHLEQVVTFKVVLLLHEHFRKLLVKNSVRECLYFRLSLIKQIFFLRYH